jgi:hypothetical protein
VQLAIVLVLGVLGGPTVVVAPSTPTPREHTEQTAAPRNAIFVSPIVNAPRVAVGVGYDRSIHRLLSVGARFEYAVPKTGYAHLQGFAETLAFSLWAPRAFRGFFAEASLGFAHTVLGVNSRLHTDSIIPGVSAGLRWRFGKTFFLGASVGLRWGKMLHREQAICTFAAACPATHLGPWARASLDVGFAF